MTSVYPIPEDKRTVSAAGDDVIHLATKPAFGEKTYADCGVFTPVYVQWVNAHVVRIPKACSACFADAIAQELPPHSIGLRGGPQ
jgi:hypothetical protein